MKKRAFSLALALILCLPLMSMTAFAEEVKCKAVSANYSHTALITEDGTLWAWGNNDYGQIGDGTTEDRLSPVKIMDNVASVSAGYFSTMAITTDGTLWAWGNNVLGGLGDGTTENRHYPVRIMDNVVSVSAAPFYTMAVKTDGTLWVWGDYQYGLSPMKIMDDVASTSQAKDRTLTVALKTDGTLWAWGDNYHGQLGDGTRDSKHSPTERVKVMDNVASVSAGANNIMAVKTDGTLWAWGSNLYDFSDGITGDIWVSPRKIMDNVVAVSEGSDRTVVIKKDNTLWTWGDRFGLFGIGDGTKKARLSPVKIMDNVASVSVGLFNTMAITENGTLWAWGDNSFGQLGDGTRESRLSPVKIMGDTTSEPVKAEGNQFTGVGTQATPTSSKVLVNGNEVAFDAYNINGNNYFKLRDVANVINGSEKQFEVTWDGSKNAINLISNKAYTVVGGEMSKGNGTSKNAAAGTSKIYKDGVEVTLTAYKIGDNNYFKLRDLGEKFNFNVSYDAATKSIVINTAESYTAD